MPGDSKECRQHAMRCAELAENVKNVEFKQTYLVLAKQWEMFAAELALDEAMLRELNEGAVINSEIGTSDEGRDSPAKASSAPMQTMLHP